MSSPHPPTRPSYSPLIASKSTNTTSLGSTRCRLAVACFVLCARCKRNYRRKPQRNELQVHPAILPWWFRQSWRCEPASGKCNFLADVWACGRLVSAHIAFQPADRIQLWFIASHYLRMRWGKSHWYCPLKMSGFFPCPVNSQCYSQ